MIKAILFDLDGTLLPMDVDEFFNACMTSVLVNMSKYDYDSDKFLKSFYKGIAAMVNNDGKNSNEETFWNILKKEYGDKIINDKHIFQSYYENNFQEVKKVCGFNPLAKQVISTLKDKGYRLILATNPLFSKVATESRIKWAGLEPNDFEVYTTYENSFYCKPNLEYYKDLLNRIGCVASECLMVGNNVDEDMIVDQIGMKTFLVTDCLINSNNVDISKYKNGNLKDLLDCINGGIYEI